MSAFPNSSLIPQERVDEKNSRRDIFIQFIVFKTGYTDSVKGYNRKNINFKKENTATRPFDATNIIASSSLPPSPKREREREMHVIFQLSRIKFYDSTAWPERRGPICLWVKRRRTDQAVPFHSDPARGEIFSTVNVKLQSMAHVSHFECNFCS